MAAEKTTNRLDQSRGKAACAIVHEQGTVKTTRFPYQITNIGQSLGVFFYPKNIDRPTKHPFSYYSNPPLDSCQVASCHEVPPLWHSCQIVTSHWTGFTCKWQWECWNVILKCHPDSQRGSWSIAMSRWCPLSNACTFSPFLQKQPRCEKKHEDFTMDEVCYFQSWTIIRENLQMKSKEYWRNICYNRPKMFRCLEGTRQLRLQVDQLTWTAWPCRSGSMIGGLVRLCWIYYG